MSAAMERLLIRSLRCLAPETAHSLVIGGLEHGLYVSRPSRPDARLNIRAFGLTFPNPVGVAAGFDKDARAFRAVLAKGAGFAEVGTLTPRPQAGNPKPRIFRLAADRAVINRLGFNNGGHAGALPRLSGPLPGIVGVNIGANKDSADRADDYAQGVAAFAPLASYLMVNISSPNTPGLRSLQAPAELDGLITRVLEARERTVRAGIARCPIVVKLAPDLADEDLPGIISVLMHHNVDGIAISNTTLSRDGLTDRRHRSEAGGLSGQPLFRRSTRMLARVHLLTEGRVPLIGIGGIDGPERALDKIRAGATLLQLYTGLVYGGFGLISRINKGLSAELDRLRLPELRPIIGTAAKAWSEAAIGQDS
ncbi:MAG: quinone-dependent dihydroorotate dehydrogenase [Hyphomicrobiaceae bacterium]